MSRSGWMALIVAEVVALCCCASLLAFVVFGNSEPPVPTPTLVARATTTPQATPTLEPTATAERTNTLVIQPRTTGTTVARTTPGARTPTRSSTGASNPYNIVVPTPTAPRVVYPIDYYSSLTVTTYSVAGKTVKELSQSLDASSLTDPHEPGNRYYARTDWFLSAHWLWKETTNGCEVDKGDVSVTMTMTLPALSTTAGVPSELLSRWNTFIQNTETHEIGHVKLAQQGARDYQRDLGNFLPAPNCNIIQTRLRDLFDKSFSSIDKANVDYDARTQHGFTQGAVFP